MFQSQRLTSSNSFFCQSISPKPEDSSFNITKDKEKQQIISFKKLKTDECFTFLLEKNDKIVAFQTWLLHL